MSRMRVLRRLCVLVTLLLVASIETAAPPASAHGNAWRSSDEWSINSNQAEAQTPADCEGTAGIPFGTDPGWVRVGGSPNPTTPFIQMEGQVLPTTATGYFDQQSFVTHTDAFFNHFSHDVNAFVTADVAYKDLYSNGQYIMESHENEHGKFEVEWERTAVSQAAGDDASNYPWAFPSNGDRIKVWGPHIFDCGHGDTWFGGDNEYRTEIHPPVGWVVFRNSTDRDGTPDPVDRRFQNPWKWFEPSDRGGAGATFAATGLLNTPVQTTIADAVFSSYGGDIPEALNGCDGDDAPCTQDNEWRQNLLQQDYSFFVPAPPGAPAGARMVWSSQDRCNANGFTIMPSPANPPGDDVEDVGEAGGSGDPTAVNIGGATCGIGDIVTEGTDSYGRKGINVTVNANDPSVTYPGNNYIAFAKRYQVGWDYVPTAAARTRTYQVNFNTLRVYNDSEPCSEDGEWVLSLRVNESWIHPVRGHGDDNDPFWADGAVDDDLCDGGDIDYLDYAIGESLTVSVPNGEQINVWSRGWENDGLANDFLPVLNKFHTGAGSFSARTSVIGSADPADYELFYTITEIDTTPPTEGTLTIGDPKYGPNANTSGGTRVTSSTPLTFTGSNASQLEFRLAPDGSPFPAAWTFDNSAPFNVSLAGQPDGLYNVEYAPVSAGGIVGERHTVKLQLDNTPPVLTVPSNMQVDATEAAGTIVNYTISAVDALPGPVTSGCDRPSGSFFPIKTVTTVTCTASDVLGNSVQKQFTIEVVSPFGYIPDFVALGRQWVKTGEGVQVQTGNVGAFDHSSGVPGLAPFEVVLGPHTNLGPAGEAAGESDKLLAFVQGHDVFRVDTLQAEPTAVFTEKIGYVPLFLGMPIVPSFTATGRNKSLSGTKTLPPGNYGALRLSPNAVVTLTGGDYFFKSIDVGSRAKLLFSAPTNVHVTGRVVVRNLGSIAPASGAVQPKQIVFWVKGYDGGAGSPTAFYAQRSTSIAANIYAFNGTLTLGPQATGRGAFLGLRVDIGSEAVLNLDSSFDYPYP